MRARTTECDANKSNRPLKKLPFKALLLDLDNTLIDRSAAVHRYFSSLLIQTHPDENSLKHQQILLEIHEQDQLGYTERHVFFQWLSETHFPSRTPQQLWSDFKQKMPRSLEPDTDCLALLKLLKQQYLLAIITNGSSDVQRAKLQVSHIDQLIDHIFISGETDFEKPEPQLFHLALESLGVSSEEALYIGDHPQADVAGAIGAGMQACWISMNREFPVELPQPQYQISSIFLLPSVLP